MYTTYQTEHLILKILTPDWAKSVLNFYKNNKTRFEPWEPDRAHNFYTIEYQKRVLYYEYLAFKKGTMVRYWFFTKTDPEKPAGTICFHNIIHGIFQSCTIGYKTDKHFIHQGYTLEAIQKTLWIMFTSLEIHRINAYIRSDNFASLELIEKAGFTKEGLNKSYAKLNGTWYDHVCFSYINPFQNS